MRARGWLPGWLAIAMLAQLSCAEIPTAPRRVATVHGTILTRDGDPVPRANLIFREPQGSGQPRIVGAITASDGSLTLSLAEGTYQVLVFPDEWSGLPKADVAAFRVAGSEPRFDYRYGGVRIEGTILDPHGAPCPLVDLDFSSTYPPQGPYVHAAYRAYNGQYRVYLPPGNYDVWANPFSIAAGAPTIRFRNMHFAADTTCDLALTGRRITGRATGPDGEPLPSATIFYGSEDAGVGVSAHADGSYEAYLPDGVYSIEAFPGPSTSYIQSRPFGHVSIVGDLVHDIAFVGAWWQGTVRSPDDGAPVAGANVEADIVGAFGYARSARAVTDANGAYRISVASPEWHDLRVSIEGRKGVLQGPILAGADSTIDLVAGALSP